MSNLRTTKSESGVLISRKLLQRMLSEIEQLRVAVGRGDPGRRESAFVAADSYFREPWRIDSVTEVESRFWRYSATLMLAVDSLGTGRGFKAHPDEITTNQMFNDAEYGNGTVNRYQTAGQDAFGNGVIRSDMPSDFALKPIPAKRIVWARRVVVRREDSDVIEFRFCEPNGISGTVVCEPARLFSPDIFE